MTDNGNYSLECQNTEVVLFGGSTFQINFLLVGNYGKINFVVGENGSGKTVILKFLSFVLGLPLDPISKVAVSNEKTISLDYSKSNRAARTTFVFQKPELNFDNSSIADNIRAFLMRLGEYNNEAAQKVLIILAEDLNLSPEAFLRKPSHFSSGQLQYIAVAMRALSKVEFSVLDEPFSRLSRKQRLKLINGIDNWSRETNFIISEIPSDSRTSKQISDETESAIHYVDRKESSIELVKEIPSRQSVSYEKLASKPLHPSFGVLSDSASTWQSLTSSQALEKLKFFSDSPDNFYDARITFLPGAGESEMISGNISLYSSNDHVVSGSIDLRKGLNYIIGDNGAGKTLIMRAMCGEFYRRSPIKILLNKILTNSYLDFSGPKLLKFNKKNSIYISPEPILLSERTVDQELEFVDDIGIEFVTRARAIMDVDGVEDVTALP